MKIAFLGIGLMGQPMSHKLIEAGFSLQLWNRSPEKMAPFSTIAKLCTSTTEAISDADIIITMLENGDVVDQVLYQSKVYQNSPKGSLFIDMSSIPPAMAKRHAKLIAEHGAHYLDAPVSGGTAGAEQGTLSVMAGGERTQFERAQAIFNALGKATYIGEVGCGQLCKLANQAIVGITIGAVSEALLLASEGGADPEAVREALSGGFASSRILELHGRRMLDRDFLPGATSRVQLKDLKTILDEARNEGLSLPLSQRTYDSYLSLVANGHENVDHSGLLLELERLNQTQLKQSS
jgi:2-hydroxy-3-oxopropionate reductase